MFSHGTTLDPIAGKNYPDINGNMVAMDVTCPFVPANPQELAPFLASPEGEEFRQFFIAEINKLSAFANVHGIQGYINGNTATAAAILQTFINDNILYTGTDEDINRDMLVVYKDGLRELVRVNKLLAADFKTLTLEYKCGVVAGLISEIAVCPSGSTTNIKNTLNIFLGQLDGAIKWKKLRDETARSLVLRLLNPYRLPGAGIGMEIHYVNTVLNIFASAIAIDHNEDAYVDYCDPVILTEVCEAFRSRIGHELLKNTSAELKQLLHDLKIADFARSLDPAIYRGQLTVWEEQLSVNFGVELDKIFYQADEIFTFTDETFGKNWKAEYIMHLSLLNRTANLLLFQNQFFQAHNICRTHVLRNDTEIHYYSNHDLVDAFVHIPNNSKPHQPFLTYCVDTFADVNPTPSLELLDFIYSGQLTANQVVNIRAAILYFMWNNAEFLRTNPSTMYQLLLSMHCLYPSLNTSTSLIAKNILLNAIQDPAQHEAVSVLFANKFRDVEEISLSPLQLAAFFGHESLVKFLLQKGFKDTSETIAAIELATVRSHSKIIKLLQSQALQDAIANHDVDQSLEFLNDGVELICENIEVAQALERYPNESLVPFQSLTLLDVVLESNSTKVLKEMIYATSLNQRRIISTSTLFKIADSLGRSEAIRNLFPSPQPLWMAITPLHFLALHPNFDDEILKLITTHSTDVDCKMQMLTPDGWVDSISAFDFAHAMENGRITDAILIAKFIKAAKDDDVETLELLEVVDENSKDAYGETALHHAVRGGCLEAINYLIFEREALPDIVNDNNHTPLQIAIEIGADPKVIACLLSSDVDPDGINLDEETDNEATPLFTAIINARKEMIRPLLEKGANPNKKSFNISPLFWAVKYNNFDMVRHLLTSRNIDINIGVTLTSLSHKALNLPLNDKCLELFEVPIDAEYANFSPLQMAVLNNHIDILKLLLAHDAEIDINNPLNPLALAEANNNQEISRVIEATLKKRSKKRPIAVAVAVEDEVQQEAEQLPEAEDERPAKKPRLGDLPTIFSVNYRLGKQPRRSEETDSDNDMRLN